MKKYLPVLLLGGLLAQGTPFAQEQTAPEPESIGPDTVIATINGEPIPLGLFRLFYAERLRMPNAKNTPAFQNQAFNEFINIIVTAQNAEEKGLDRDPNVQNALELQRLRLLSGVALQDAARTLSPTQEAIQAAYDQRYGAEKGKEYRARHILVKTEEEAKDLIRQLDAGADFQALAKEKSLGPTGKKGGDLGWFDPKQMVPAFSEAVMTLKPGHYTKSPVKTQFGWHVILLEEERDAKPPTLEAVKGKLSAELQRKMLMEFVGNLQSQAKIELNTDLIKTNRSNPDPSAKAETPKP